MIYKGIAFDIDGTLYPEWHLRSLSMVGPMLRHPKLFRAYKKTRESLRSYDYVGDLRREQAVRVGKLLGVSTDQAEEQIECNLYQPWDRAYRRIQPFPGVSELLQWLQQQAMPLAALSDFPVSHKLETLGVAQFFSCNLSSEDTGYLKPHKAPFIALAQAMGVAPEEILYVGNSYRKDVEGAAAVGMGTVLIGSLPKHVSVTPNLVIPTYQDAIQQFSDIL